MESELPREQIEREMRRVAAAFWVEEWEVTYVAKGQFCGFGSRCDITWRLKEQTAALCMVQVQKDGVSATRLVQLTKGVWTIFTGDRGAEELMARGLYRLGIEDESVLSQLPPLSAHQKLELRLSMPRELWPQNWREETAV